MGWDGCCITARVPFSALSLFSLPKTFYIDHCPILALSFVFFFPSISSTFAFASICPPPSPFARRILARTHLITQLALCPSQHTHLHPPPSPRLIQDDALQAGRSRRWWCRQDRIDHPAVFKPFCGGKPCSRYFLWTYDPTIEDSYRKQVVIDDQSCVLEVLDTAGQEEYTALRDQWIRDGEGFLLVYSIAARSTFERIKRFRDQITRVKDSENVPLMLVGNKCDKLTEREVSRDEGYQMSKLLRCEFTETSAKTCVNVERSFYNVVRMIRQARDGGVPGGYKSPKKKTKCSIL